ncbi:S46 family peptidase [Lysobacter firmicutimachus]|uniref:Dipeptidyl-peptidase n=1 Tax=Lysobacter firmicutimachus TaxID=1792846 RepID=A0AAU8MPS3_9GAMM
MRYTVLARAVVVAGGLFGLAAWNGPALAVEGLWTPSQWPELAPQLKLAGLRATPKQLAQWADPKGDPLGAVVPLGSCTASFVSPKGLLLTNHHCALGAIQLNSTAQKNLLRDGFRTGTNNDEVSAGPNARIFVLDSVQDVTARVQTALSAAADPLARIAALDALERQLIAECEAERGYACRLYSYSGGNRYQLQRNIEIRDLRLVYAPPDSIGNFGGENDNWRWPRHTGDFAFYRAYVGQDGKPAAFAIDNVPYQPKRWLKIADKPLGAGDFVAVAGFPSLTNRYAMADDFAANADWTYPTVAGHYRRLAALVESETRKSPEIAGKYAATVRGWQGAAVNYDRQLEGFRRAGAVQAKREEEAALLAWLRKQGAAGEPALAAHARLLELGAQARAVRERELILGQLFATGSLGAATQLYRNSIERAKPDAQREAGYRQRDAAAFENGLRQADRRSDPRVDRALYDYWLREYLKLPKEQRVAALDQWLEGDDEKAVKRALDRLGKARLGTPEQRAGWLKADSAAFEKSKDGAIQFAIAAMPTLLQSERDIRNRAGETLSVRPAYLKALADFRKSQGRVAYPDANGSLRLGYGTVVAYTKDGGAKPLPFTRAEEIAARHTGSEPFKAPPVLLEGVRTKRYGALADKRLGSLPVNFLSDLDISGGNSGSPVLDGQGKLAGLVFDSNLESVSASWVFDPAATRTISVDQRYMRWIMQEVFPAPRLLAEMGVPAGGK